MSCQYRSVSVFHCFFFNDTATTEIYTLSLHDALPILAILGVEQLLDHGLAVVGLVAGALEHVEGEGHRLVAVDAVRVDVLDRKSTRLNSSHANISYAVFCLKKKKKQNIDMTLTE